MCMSVWGDSIVYMSIIWLRVPKFFTFGFYFKPVYQGNLLPETILDRELTYRTDITCFQEILLS